MHLRYYLKNGSKCQEQITVQKQGFTSPAEYVTQIS